MSQRAMWMALLLVACDAAAPVAGVWCQYPSDCASPNECSYSRCRPRCTTGADCPDTNLCIAGHCSVAEDRGCASVAGHTCASPLVCAGDQCSTECTTSCPGGAICRAASGSAISICVAPGTPEPDAGAATADGG